VTTRHLTAPPSGGYAFPRGELRGLTGLRAVAAVWVVLFHFHLTPLPGIAEMSGVLGPVISSGALGVDLFFVLSGFVIAHTYLDRLGPALRVRATARYVWARACRLWPAYALVLHLFGAWLAARAVFGQGGEIAFQSVQPVLDAGQYVQQLFMVQLWDDAFFDGSSWVGSTWSISAEWLAYLLFPLAALVLYRMRHLPVVVLGTLALVLMLPMAWAYLSTGSPYFPGSWLVRILCGFGAGALAYVAVRRLRWTSTTRRRASTLATVLPVTVVAGLLVGELVGPGRGGAVLVLFPPLVAVLAVADRGPAVVLSSRCLVYGGRLSYCLYLVHIPLFEVYWLALRESAALAPHTALAHAVGGVVLVATVGVAALAHHLVEEPSRRKLRAFGPAAAFADDAMTTAVARFAAKRQALAEAARRAEAGTGPRQAVPPPRPATLAMALVNAQRGRTAHRSESELWGCYERAEHVRAAYLQAGG
jgi:peptidoglycan/LPS O-acetylase OafA/YrhL